MPQQESNNQAHRRDPVAGAALPDDPFQLWENPLDAMIRRMSCTVPSVNTPGPPPVQTTPLDHHDAGLGGAWRERSAVLRQQLGNELHGYGFVSDARRKNRTVAEVAADYRGSRAWGVDDKSRYARNVNMTRGSSVKPHIFWAKSDKCNEFVADVLIEAGYPSPVVAGTNRLASAREYALSSISIDGLSAPLPLSMAQRGDIIAQDHWDGTHPWGHVGIVIARGSTASANAKVGGIITINDWGFRMSPGNGEPSKDTPPPMIRRVQWRAAYQGR